MLCPTCPKRQTCQAMCADLKREMSRIEGFQFEALQNPKKFAKAEGTYATQRYLHDQQADVETSDPFSETKQMALDLALEDLSFRQRECIQLYYWEGLSQNQIASRLGLSRQAVAQRLKAALAILRKNHSEGLRELFAGVLPSGEPDLAPLHIYVGGQ